MKRLLSILIVSLGVMLSTYVSAQETLVVKTTYFQKGTMLNRKFIQAEAKPMARIFTIDVDKIIVNDTPKNVYTIISNIDPENDQPSDVHALRLLVKDRFGIKCIFGLNVQDSTVRIAVLYPDSGKVLRYSGELE